MWEFKACFVCFSTNVKVYNMDEGELRQDFNLLSGLSTKKNNGLPNYLCVVCAAYVKKFCKFRSKCHRAHFALQELLLRNGEIKKTNLEAIDRNCINNAPMLSYLEPAQTYYEEIKFQWVKKIRLGVIRDSLIHIQHCNTFSSIEDSEVPKKKSRIQIDDENIKDNEELKADNVATETQTPEYNDDKVVDDINDNFNFDSDNDIDNDADDVEVKENDADGCSNLDEEYATMIPISKKEAMAAVEIYKSFTHGKIRCDICGKSYFNENRLKIHLRMHDKHVSGNYFCEMCKYYYKSEFLLKTHLTEKHMYKYVCRKCPEVNFDRISAKQHYIWVHLQKGNKKNANWYETRPTWLSSKGGKRVKGSNKLSKGANVVSLRPVKKIKKLPEDFLVYSPVSQEEQYALVQERRNSRNYNDARFKCELCFRGFRELVTYDKHMKKHDPEYSGLLQCDMCKLHFSHARKLYKHMIITHLFKYSCQLCHYICYNRGQAHMHYRWHKNVTYKCPHCSLEFKKASTRLTHIRIKHPSTNICNFCGHSFVSEAGLYCHKKIAHSKEEIEASDTAIANKDDPLYCADCKVQFLNQAAFKTHLGSSSKHASINISTKPNRTIPVTERKRPGRPRRSNSDILNNGVPTSTYCEVCGKFLVNDSETRKHYESEHPGAEYLKRYMCDVCGHTTKQYANLMVHMRTHTHEKPYGCPHCDRRFSMPSNRDRHIVVHTGEKRYQCQHCSRRFTQSSAVKLHIQTVHLKIPYAPWDKKNRKRKKELEGTSAPVSAVTTVTDNCLQPQQKLLIDTQGDYLNAYITYNE